MSVIPAIQRQIEDCYTFERLGEISRAFQCAQAAVEAARGSRHAESLASALASLAYVENRLGHFERARALAEEALACACPPSQAQATALRILGDCAHEQNDPNPPGTYTYSDGAGHSGQVLITGGYFLYLPALLR